MKKNVKLSAAAARSCAGRYRLLPPGSGAKLRRLTRSEGFREFPGMPHPGGPALWRSFRDGQTEAYVLEVVVVAPSGELWRFPSRIVPLQPLKSTALQGRQSRASRTPNPRRPFVKRRR